MTAETLEPDIAAWRRLYAAADRIKKIAPWEWMEETDVFGVQFPGGEDIGYVSVMGALGEHLAVSLYLGDTAFQQFLTIQNAPDDSENVERILEAPQLMMSFEDREMLLEKDQALIRKLGLKYRGRNAWPFFRSYRPGYYPWFLENEEIEKLTLAAEQTIAVAEGFEEDDAILETENEDEYRIRIPGKSNEGWTWRDDARRISASSDFSPEFSMSRADIERLKRLPGSSGCVDVDFFLSPAGVAEPGKRPTYTYMLLMVESESGFILGFELLQALDGIQRMWEQVPSKLAGIFHKAGFLPESLRAESLRLYRCIAPLTKEIEVEIALYDSLPAIRDAKESLMSFMAVRK